jgi:hypothetical protein
MEKKNGEENGKKQKEINFAPIEKIKNLSQLSRECKVNIKIKSVSR